HLPLSPLEPNSAMKFRIFWVALPAMLLAQVFAHAAVERFEIVQRQPFAGGQAFGDVGPYEAISGRVHYRLNVEDPANAEVIDLPHAQADEQGGVTFTADLFILAPKDLAKCNGAVLYDV